MNTKQLSVRFYGQPVGMLEQTPAGKMKFTYDQYTIQAISIGMPLREEAYDELRCEAFFGGLLPENEHMREIIGRKYGVSPNNSFSLLKVIGHDCAGAVSFHEMNEAIVPTETFPLKGRILSEAELYQHIKDLPKKPLFIGEDLRLSLAGVQDKAAVCVVDGKIALPLDGCPTTHILKPSIPEYENTVENEYFCLKLEKHLGLQVPEVEIRHLQDISFLLIERYDREVHDGVIRCFHQEDFCQALNSVSAKKYQNEGGPGFKECFELLKKTTQPIIDRNALAEGMVFNFLIGNMDAHGKNFSLLHKGHSFLGLAPFYDLLCTRIYPSLSSKMAMKIGNTYDSEDVFPRHWERLSSEIEYSYPALKNILTNQAESVLEVMRDNLLTTQGSLSFISKMVEFTDRHINQVLSQLKL